MPEKVRLELFKNLREAILQPEKIDTYLGWAKYWLTTYYDNYQEETDLIKAIDIDEGSARYFEIAITCRAIGGFFYSTDEVYTVYRQHVDDFFYQLN